MNKVGKLSTVVLALASFIYGAAPVLAGTLEFDGVPVDITTTDNEDLVIVPGTGGNTQIGTGTANTNATANNDLYVSGVLEADGVFYADGGMIAASHVIPSIDATDDLGSSTKYWKNFYVNSVYAGDISKIKAISYSWPDTQGSTSTVLTNDGSGNLTWASVGGVSGVAPTDASYITQTADSTLSAEQALSSLSTGIMKVTTATGVVSSITDSAGIAGVLSDETGSGKVVFDTSPTLVTPVLGVASATTVNKLTITAPATGSTLTIADGKTLTVSNDATLSGTNTGDQTLSDATLSTSDITTNNVSTSKHGFVPKSPNDATKYLDGTGAYSTPAGAGDVAGPASSTDNALARFDSTTGKLIQNSGVIVDDSNNLSGVASVTLATAGALQTSTSDTNTLLLKAYDVDGISYTTFGTLTAGNTPTFDLSDSVTKSGAYIYRAGGTDVPLADGGTNNSITASNGAMVYSDTTKLLLSAVGSSGQILRSAGAGAPTWSTATFPATAGNSGNILTSDGTNWASSVPATVTDAAADGSTKGIATYTASDFNAASGVISLDYTNAQAADASNKGFLTAADWTTFNSKQAAGSYITASSVATLTNKTFDTAGSGNSLSINGTAVSAVTGSGSVVLATSPTISSPTITNPSISNPFIQGEKVAALTDAATIATDASLGNVFWVSSATDRTLGVPTNPTSGQKSIWRWKNSDVSSRTLTLTTSGAGSFRFGTSIQTTTATTAGKTDYIGAIYNATDDKWDVIA